MAYLDLTTGAPFPGVTFAPATITRPALGQLEREAVLLARTDRVASLHAPEGIARIAAWLFGFRGPNRLADVRLEALRRFAVAVAHGTDALAAREREQLRSLGYANPQIEQVDTLAVRWASKPQRSFAGALVLPILVAALTWFISGYVEDGLMCLVVAVTIILPFWAALAPRPGSGRA